MDGMKKKINAVWQKERLNKRIRASQKELLTESI